MYKDIDFKKIGFNVSNIGFYKVSKLGKIYRINLLHNCELNETGCVGGKNEYPYFKYYSCKIRIVDVLISHYLGLDYKNTEIKFKDGNKKNTRVDNIICYKQN